MCTAEHVQHRVEAGPRRRRVEVGGPNPESSALAVDLINQRQLLALIGNSAPPYAQGSEALVTAMRDFDHAYNAYNEFQTRMERYWCLQYLLQEQLTALQATVWRENLVRLDGMPFITKVHSLPELAPGTRVQLEVKRVDPLLMELDCRYSGLLDPG